MSQPHKYAEVIKAWADGAAVQIYCPATSVKGWVDCPFPEWVDHHIYRIKPEEKPYAQIYAETAYPTTDYREGWSGAYHERMRVGVEAVLDEFCKRNNLNRSCYK